MGSIPLIFIGVSSNPNVDGVQGVEDHHIVSIQAELVVLFNLLGDEFSSLVGDLVQAGLVTLLGLFLFPIGEPKKTTSSSLKTTNHWVKVVGSAVSTILTKTVKSGSF